MDKTNCPTYFFFFFYEIGENDPWVANILGCACPGTRNCLLRTCWHFDQNLYIPMNWMDCLSLTFFCLLSSTTASRLYFFLKVLKKFLHWVSVLVPMALDTAAQSLPCSFSAEIDKIKIWKSWLATVSKRYHRQYWHNFSYFILLTSLVLYFICRFNGPSKVI